MRTLHLFPYAVAALLATTSCDKNSPETSRKIAELEHKNNETDDRQHELEQELADQKIAAERDSIERERQRINEERTELERLEGEEVAAQSAALREREQELANREDRLEHVRSELDEKEEELGRHEMELTDRDRDLAGREAIDFDPTPQSEPVADYGMFYDSLASYGSWFETEDYGYVWQPVVVRDSNWRPYSRGRWACTDRGWTWISEEPFGWATYHYGRWAQLRGRGWIWVPGSEWSPCWVSWRESPSHIGWAPLPPETLAYSGHAWDSTVDVQFAIGISSFSFVEIQHFGNPIFSHCLPIRRNRDCFGSTTNITHLHFCNGEVICGGPKYREICDRLGKQMPFYRFRVDDRPQLSRDQLGLRPRIRGNHLLVSAPNVNTGWNEGIRPRNVKGRIESISVEREGNLSGEISRKYRDSREQGRKQAERKIDELGGVEKFDRIRQKKLPGSRGGVALNSRDHTNRAIRPEDTQPPRGNDRPSGGNYNATESRPQPTNVGGQRPVNRPAEREDRQRRNPAMPNRGGEAATRLAERKESPQGGNRENQEPQGGGGAAPAREVSNEPQGREEEQFRDRARRQAAEEAQRKQARQRQEEQEENRRQAERAQRQQKEEQQRDTQRQQERDQRQRQEKNQRQQEQARQQRQQEERQHQQEEGQRQQRQQEERQRKQEEGQRQQRQHQQEERQRQREESRQKENDGAEKRRDRNR